MNFWKSINPFKWKQFLNRIFLIMALVFIAVLIIYTSIIYFNTGDAVYKIEFEKNKKILQQMKYNVDFMDITVKNYCKTFYKNADIASLMYDDTLKEYERFTMVNELYNYSYVNPFIHSVFIYNNATKEYYSAYNNIYFHDTSLESLIAGYQGDIPRLRMISRSMNDTVYNSVIKRDVFTYIFYEDIDTNHMPKGALIVNINPKWLSENIKLISNTDENFTEQIFVINKNNEFVNDNTKNSDLKAIVANSYLEMKKTSDNGYMVKKINGEKYILTYLYAESVDLLIVKAQRYEVVFLALSSIKKNITFMLVIFVLMTVLVLIPTTMRVYAPINKLIQSVSSRGRHEEIKCEKDEISYLNKVFEAYKNSMDQYQIDLLSYKQTYKSLFFRKLLSDYEFVMSEEWNVEHKEINTTLNFDEHFVICLLKVDGYGDIEKNISLQDRQIIKFAIINIFTEIFSSRFATDGVDMDDDKVVMLLNSDMEVGAFNRKLEDLFTNAQKAILEYFHITVTATVSNLVTTISQIPAEYDLIGLNARYKYIFGKMSFITSDKVKQNKACTRNHYSKDSEKNLLKAINTGDFNSTAIYVEEILSEISNFKYNNIIMCQISLLNIISEAVDNVNRHSLLPTCFHIEQVNLDIFDFETINHFKSELMRALSEWMDKRQEKVAPEKHMVLVENVQEIINKNYFDNNLCLDEIASRLKMSPRYLGRIFKEATNHSVIEYLNDVRMMKATELLENKDYAISKVMEMSGIENESYFYKLFKKKFGTTPKEYAMYKAINKN